MIFIWKKIDLHIHTRERKNIGYDEFEFSMEYLKKYVEINKLDAIAITNHNKFYLENFQEINSQLLDVIVYPGIEIDLKEGGHLLLIYKSDLPRNELILFEEKCNKVSELNTGSLKREKNFSYNDLLEVFGDLNQYLIIPHYDKSPKVKKETLDNFGQHFFCGEVQSLKKWVSLHKKDRNITPVIFSDIRASKENYKKMMKYYRKTNVYDVFENITYVNCEKVGLLSSLKIALQDKSKVSLSKKNNTDLFDIPLEGMASNRLNVIIGKRATGKSITLNLVKKMYDKQKVDVKYIKQFDLVKENAETLFNEKINKVFNNIRLTKLKLFSAITAKALDYLIQSENISIAEYLNSIKKNVTEKIKHDAYSSTKLFEVTKTLEVKAQKDLLEDINHVLASIDIIMKNKEIEGIFNKIFLNQNKNVLLQFGTKLLLRKKKIRKKLIIYDYTNKAVNKIREELKKESSKTQIATFDIKKWIERKSFLEKYNNLINKFKEEQIYTSEGMPSENYKLLITKSIIKNIPTKNNEQKKAYERTGLTMARHQLYECKSGTDMLLYLLKKEKTDNITRDSFYKAFFDYKFTLCNKEGRPLSGGEKAEYNFMDELKSGQNADVILIDEPESSFDNPYLYHRISKQIKEMSNNKTIFLSTHNPNLAVNINPDYLIYKEKKTCEKQVKYQTYYGPYISDKLENLNELTKNTNEALINLMEASPKAYEQRKLKYEIK